MKVVLGRLAKLRKATINFVIYVCLYAWNISAPAGQIFMKINIEYFSKICRENSNLIKI